MQINTILDSVFYIYPCLCKWFIIYPVYNLKRLQFGNANDWIHSAYALQFQVHDFILRKIFVFLSSSVFCVSPHLESVWTQQVLYAHVLKHVMTLLRFARTPRSPLFVFYVKFDISHSGRKSVVKGSAGPFPSQKGLYKQGRRKSQIGTHGTSE